MALFTSIAMGNFDDGPTWDQGGATPSNGDTLQIDHIVTYPAGSDSFDSGGLTISATGSLDIEWEFFTFHADSVTDIAASRLLDCDVDITLGGTFIGAGFVLCSGNITFATSMDWSGFTGQLVFDQAATAHILTTNGVTGPYLRQTGAGQLTAQDITTLAKWSHEAGTYVDGTDLDHFIGGDIRDLGGTFTSASTWEQTASGDVQGGTFSHIKLGSAGVVSNLSSDLHVYECTIGPGDSGVAITGANNLVCFYTGHDRWHQTSASGTIDVTSVRLRLAGDFNIGYLNLFGMGAQLLAYSVVAGTKTLTLTDRWRLDNNTFALYGGSDDQHIKLACGAFGIDITNAITLGHAAGDRSGLIDFGTGKSAIASVVDAGAASTLNAIDFGSAYLQCSGALDLDNIAHTSTADNLVHIEGLGTGQIDNCDPATIIHAHNMIDGGTNNAVNGLLTFNEHAPPGSMAMMGVGI